MAEEYSFKNSEEFIHKLEELVKEGANRSEITLFTPYHVHGVEEILDMKPSKLKYFTLAGAVTGFCTGMGFTSYSNIVWPLITGGKPLISIPAFLVIAFELTILLGAIFSLIGLLVLSRLPNPLDMVPPKEYGNKFVIVVDKDKDK